ncbi:MAG: hypothetical protein AABY15_03650 [Nanoarchaeota archaeon]
MKSYNKNKKAIEFSFTWLFAVIIGTAILVLAIYAATKILSTGGAETSAAAAKEIGVLLNPLETGFEAGVSTSLSLPTDTRIYNGCDNFSGFGKQQIQVAQKSFGRFSEPSVNVSFPNKYIFSNETEEGKKFLIFSKPFEFPFKVANLIYLTSSNEKYCFIDAPENIKSELSQLKQENLLVANCSTSPEFIMVCFDTGTSCDIEVRYNSGYLKKNGDRLRFATDALMYAAIFSGGGIYECQASRLMQRAEELSSIYIKKANLLQQKDCNSNLDLLSLLNSFRSYEDSSDLRLLSDKAEEIEVGNRVSSCRLW